MLTYDNTTIVTDEISEIEHRRNCDTKVTLKQTFNSLISTEFPTLQLPLITAPMPDICNGKMAYTLAYNSYLGVIHRFQSIDDQVREFSYPSGFESTKQLRSKIACAIGVTDDYQKRFESLYTEGCRIFCLDTANGANKQVRKAIEWIRNWTNESEQVFLIAGNVATSTGFTYLQNLGVDAIRVGIAGGSVCETKTETGIHLPTLESVLRCRNVQTTSLIIADGGVRTPADMCKAIVAGADLVMAGRIFAGYIETPGVTKKYGGILYKEYRGAASYSVQQENDQLAESEYIEGSETLVPYIHKSVINKVFNRFRSGLQSSMSYANAKDLTQYRLKTRLERL